MATPRRFRESGHKRKLLAIIDGTPECAIAVRYAARRAAETGGGLVLLYVVEPADFQGWLGVEAVMRAEATERAETALGRFVMMAREKAGSEPETVVREGRTVDEIHRLIDEDADIGLIVLAAGGASEGPGPLVSAVAARNAPFAIPVTIVPAGLADEELDAIA